MKNLFAILALALPVSAQAAGVTETVLGHVVAVERQFEVKEDDCRVTFQPSQRSGACKVQLLPFSPQESLLGVQSATSGIYSDAKGKQLVVSLLPATNGYLVEFFARDPGADMSVEFVMSSLRHLITQLPNGRVTSVVQTVR